MPATAPSIRARAGCFLLSILAMVASVVVSDTAHAATRSKPDVILIVTDDQRADTLRFMPRTRRWLTSRFTNAFVSNPSCCPSRTSILTGAFSRTSGVWTNGDGPEGSVRDDHGGWPRYAELSLDDTSIPAALQRRGYRTAHFGKFLNEFGASTAEELPGGWDEFAAFASGGAFARGRMSPYYEYSLVGRNGERFAIESYGTNPRDHSSNVLTRKAVRFLRSGDGQSVLLHLSYPTPHSRGGPRPPAPLPQDLDRRVDLPPLSDAVNEDNVDDKPVFIQRRPGVSEDAMNRWRRAVARSLIGLDRKIDRVLRVQEGRDRGLRNTLVLFISDNGFLHGEHRWFGKGVPYDPAIRVPLLGRWRDWPSGARKDIVSNVDIAATIADVTGADFDAPDGISLSRAGRRYALLEGVGAAQSYCGVRTLRAKYVKYATGEVEFYDLKRDPLELRSRPRAELASRYARLASRVCTGALPPGWPAEVPY